MALLGAVASVASVNSPIVIAGAGLHGSALAYYLTQRGERPLIVERHSVAAAASGKGGGFLARDWGSGPTVGLHRVSFALHEELAQTLGVESYRKIPVLSVTPGPRTARTKDLCPWLDGEGVADTSWLDKDGGAQVAPQELCTKLMDAAVANGATLRIGTVEGLEKEAIATADGVTDGEATCVRPP
jgi:glycine/D-amino acid oxidase-like deaminating enzyme